MNYKGYAARLEYSEEDSLFVGHIAGIRDVVGFLAAQWRSCEQHSLTPWTTTWIPAPSWDARPRSLTPASSACAWSLNCMPPLP